MKKLLLTLLLLLSLGFAASAATELELFNVTANTSFSSTGSASETESTLTVNGYDFKVMNVWWQKNAANSYFAFKKATPAGYMILPVFADKKITRMSLYLPSGLTKNTKFDVYANGVKIGATITWTAAGAWQDFEIPAENQAAGTEYKIQSANTNNQIGLGRLKIFYEEAGQKEKITLEESNLVIKAGEQVIEGDEVELDANTTLTFSYNTNNPNADITYSYSDDTEFTEGQSYTFTGEKDVVLTVKATSENEVEKVVMISKKYPTECPTPVFSVADGAEVYAGQVITVKADGAESLHLTANDVDVDGTSYTVVGNPGDEITLYALASVMGKNGEITADATITVKVIEATEATFNFIAKTYGLKVISDNNDGYEDSVSEITEGIASMSFTGNYRLWETTDNNQLRVMSGATFTISVPDGYYIESIDFDGSVSKATSNVGSIISKVWSYSGKVSAVKFTCSGRVDINTVTVKYAKLVPTLALANVEITHGKVAGVVTIDYTFEIANHNGNEVIVTAAINGMDHIVFEKVENTPAAAPARAAGENTKVEGTLQAKHADLKGEQSFSINVKATLDGNDLYNETHTNFQTTGIEDVTIEGGEAAEYFNLQGIRVAEPQAGQVYIVRRGVKTTKELVK